MNTGKCWLWPDHTIGKRESRRLREEHNALVNSWANLLDACECAQLELQDYKALPVVSQAIKEARAL